MPSVAVRSHFLLRVVSAGLSGYCSGRSQKQPHDNIDPRRCHCVPCLGGLSPMKTAPTFGAGERRSPRWLRTPGVQKQRPGSVLEVREQPRSQRSAPPLPLAALSGMSSQLSSRQPRAAPCRACRRGCCARWPQRWWSTTGTATVLVLKMVDAAGQRAEASTDPSWPSCADQRHGLRSPWAVWCCMVCALVVESVG